MANEEHLELLRSGVDRWNEWRDAHPHEKPVLDDIALEDIDLSGLNLSHAGLRRVTFRNVKFGNCDLTQADMREAVLSGADLSGVAGFLEPQQLAGADLTGAKLPDSLKALFENLDVAKGISANAQNLFIAMLAACLYSWLTIATTSDLNLIVNHATSPLPIIGTSIPIVGFYFVAPLLLMGIYFYFHLYLQKLWDEMGSLPAIFPDGRPLQAKADPWLLSDLVRSHVFRLRRHRPFLSYLQKWISIALAWWVVPVTLMLFWGRYIRRHDMIGTTLHCLLIAVGVTSAISFYLLAGATLRGDSRRSFVWEAALRQPRTWRLAAVFALFGIALIYISLGAIDGVRLGVAGRDWWPTAEASSVSNFSPRRWVPAAMEMFGYVPFANLRGANLTSAAGNPTGKSDAGGGGAKDDDAKQGETKDGGTQNGDTKGNDDQSGDAQQSDTGRDDADRGDTEERSTKTDVATLNSVSGLQLGGIDLRFADLRGSDLRGTILTDARLEWTDLLTAKLAGAELAGARMDNADLLGADLANADLTGVSLRGADLHLTNISGAELQYADLTEAKGLTADALMGTRNWCNAMYASDFGSKALKLPPDNNDRIARWRDYQEAVIGKYPGTAGAARIEQLSRLFPGTDTKALLGRLSNSAMDEATAANENAADDEKPPALAPIPWPRGAAPVAVPMKSVPARDATLPAADYLVITWTVDEGRALAAVFTPGRTLNDWYDYAHGFDAELKKRFREGAPALETNRLGRYFQVRIGAKRVVLFKSDFHFSQDGPGLPSRDVLKRLIHESGAKIVVTTGTAGQIGRGLQVGDVVVSSRAVFLMKAEFKNEDFAGKTVASDIKIPAEQLEYANRNLLTVNASKLAELRIGPPVPRIFWGDTPEPNVVVTTDFFGFDTINNYYGLQCAGSVSEMGDAMVGLAIEDMGKSAPKWLSVRNISDGQAGAGSPRSNMERMASVYKQFGFWTTVQSAIATWAVITGTN